jgi:hypothetical protein
MGPEFYPTPRGATCQSLLRCRVAVWNDATTYADAYETVLALTDHTERALFRELYPLVEPYVVTTLLEPTQLLDRHIRIDDPSYFVPGVTLWIENDRGNRRINRVVSVEASSKVVELALGIAYQFQPGDYVIRPLVKTFNPRVESIRFDDAEDRDHLLKSSTITYPVKIHRDRDRRSTR